MVPSKSLLLQLHEFLLVNSITRASIFSATTKNLEVLVGSRFGHLLIYGLRWYVVNIDIQTKIKSFQNGWLHHATLVVDQEVLGGSNPLHSIDFWHFVEYKSIVLIIHFDHLFLEGLLEILYFLLMLFVGFFLVYIYILAIFNFLASQKFDVFYKRSTGTCWVFRLRSNTLINSVHQQNRILDFSFNNRPELLDQHTKATALLFSLLDLLIEELLTILEELNKFFVLSF